MPFDGNGNYVAPSNSWNPAVSATDIDPTDWNGTLDDLSTALSTCVTKDGQTTATGEVPFADGISTPLVQFPAVQAPSADPNALDDYEEGTWTPALQFGGAATGITYTLRRGTYTKIGNTVFAQGYFLLSSKGSATGTAALTGLPVASNATAGQYVAVTVYAFSLAAAGIANAVLGPGSQSITLSSTSGGGSAQLSNTDFGNTSEMAVSVSYQV